MSFFEIWGIGALVAWVYMTLIWIVSVRLKNASIVDPFWGAGFAVLAVTYYLLAEDGFDGRKTLITVLAAVWGLRLALHLVWRNMGKGEDYRYQQFRQKYGPQRYWWISYFQVFMLQGVLMVIISAPLLCRAVLRRPGSLHRPGRAWRAAVGRGLLLRGSGRLAACPLQSKPPTRAACSIAACGPGRATRTTSATRRCGGATT